MQLTIDGFEICIQGDPHADRPLRRVAWAGYAQKRGSSMAVSEAEKAAALQQIAASGEALDLVRRLAGTSTRGVAQDLANLIDAARVIVQEIPR
jgi:hypothetical protein